MTYETNMQMLRSIAKHAERIEGLTSNKRTPEECKKDHQLLVYALTALEELLDQVDR